MLKNCGFILIHVEYLHPYCKANILSYYSVNINIGIGIGQMCFDISVSDHIGYLPYWWIRYIRMISLLLTLILGFASDSCNNKDIILILGYNYNIASV